MYDKNNPLILEFFLVTTGIWIILNLECASNLSLEFLLNTNIIDLDATVPTYEHL